QQHQRRRTRNQSPACAQRDQAAESDVSLRHVAVAVRMVVIVVVVMLVIMMMIVMVVMMMMMRPLRAQATDEQHRPNPNDGQSRYRATNRKQLLRQHVLGKK